MVSQKTIFGTGCGQFRFQPHTHLADKQTIRFEDCHDSGKQTPIEVVEKHDHLELPRLKVEVCGV